MKNGAAPREAVSRKRTFPGPHEGLQLQEWGIARDNYDEDPYMLKGQGTPTTQGEHTPREVQKVSLNTHCQKKRRGGECAILFNHVKSQLPDFTNDIYGPGEKRKKKPVEHGRQDG